MKKIMNYTVIAAIWIAFFGTSTLVAQEWTQEQKEVWQVIQDAWSKWKEKDFDASFANVHDKYLGWNNFDPLPATKAKWMKEMKKSMENISKPDFDIEPAKILVHSNIAVVHYYYEFSFVYTAGGDEKMANYKGKNSEFYVKENDKWMLIGDMSYSENVK